MRVDCRQCICILWPIEFTAFAQQNTPSTPSGRPLGTRRFQVTRTQSGRLLHTPATSLPHSSIAYVQADGIVTVSAAHLLHGRALLRTFPLERSMTLVLTPLSRLTSRH